MFSTTDLFDYDSKIFEYDSNNNLISIKLYDANDVLIQTNN